MLGVGCLYIFFLPTEYSMNNYVGIFGLFLTYCRNISLYDGNMLNSKGHTKLALRPALPQSNSPQHPDRCRY